MIIMKAWMKIRKFLKKIFGHIRSHGNFKSISKQKAGIDSEIDLYFGWLDCNQGTYAMKSDVQAAMELPDIRHGTTKLQSILFRFLSRFLKIYVVFSLDENYCKKSGVSPCICICISPSFRNDYRNKDFTNYSSLV